MTPRALRSLYDGLCVHRYPACCVMHYCWDEARGRHDMGTVRGVVLRPTATDPGSRYVPCALHLRRASRFYDLHTPPSDGKAAPVLFGVASLDRWGGYKVIDVTDDGATGTVTLRFSGRLRRQPCEACGRETVCADNLPPSLYCCWCGEALTSGVSDNSSSSAAALSPLRSGGIPS